MKKPLVLILTGYGINADKELVWAFEMAGAETQLTHLEDCIDNRSLIKEAQILAFPGGFSFGDHIASGKVFANMVRHNLIDEIKTFIENGKPVIGICNGFQIITRLGLVPNIDGSFRQTSSLIQNESGHFEDRWVYVKNAGSDSLWLNDINTLYLPVRHGEGNFITQDSNLLSEIQKSSLIGLTYCDADGRSAPYPANPNGSALDIAGITNPQGNVLGLMPHPEAFLFPEQHPRFPEGEKVTVTGLKLFQNAVAYCKNL